MYDPLVDAELDQLMVRYQQGDAEATNALIGIVSPMLYRFFLHQAGNQEDAGDLLQETWLRVHRVRHTYRTESPVLPWLYSIARHVKVDGYRRRRRITTHEVAMEALPEVPVAVASAGNFDALMAELPESQREIITMLKVTGMSLEEVASATASTVGAVKQKAHRAYEKLRQLLDSKR